METREIIYRLLHRALIEMRVEAYTIENNKIFHLADLLHTIPLQLSKITTDEKGYEEVLEWLKNRALEKGCDKWLETALKDETN